MQRQVVLGAVAALAGLIGGCDVPQRARPSMTEFSAANGSFALVASPQIESSPGMVFDMNGPGGVGPESYRRDSQLAVGTLTADRGTQYYEPEAQPSLDDVRRIYFSRDPGTVTYYSIRGGYVRWWHGAWWR